MDEEQMHLECIDSVGHMIDTGRSYVYADTCLNHLSKEFAPARDSTWDIFDT